MGKANGLEYKYEKGQGRGAEVPEQAVLVPRTWAAHGALSLPQTSRRVVCASPRNGSCFLKLKFNKRHLLFPSPAFARQTQYSGDKCR